MGSSNVKYLKSHEWIEASGGRRKVGISDFAQDQLGDIVFVEFPSLPLEVGQGDEVLVIESCKATASVYAPVAGKVVAFNDSLSDSPEKINAEPFGEGWLFEIEVAAGAETDHLLDEAAYKKVCEEE